MERCIFNVDNFTAIKLIRFMNLRSISYEAIEKTRHFLLKVNLTPEQKKQISNLINV